MIDTITMMLRVFINIVLDVLGLFIGHENNAKYFMLGSIATTITGCFMLFFGDKIKTFLRR